jgi:hypothetical protein
MRTRHPSHAIEWAFGLALCGIFGTACAPRVIFRPSRKPDAAPIAAQRCGGPEACRQRGLDGVYAPDIDQRSEAVEDLRIACSAKDTQACDFLNVHLSPPECVDPMLPPDYPEKLRREDLHGLLVVQCTVQASGKLRDCRALKPLKGVTEDVLRWLDGKHCVPARLDGQPIRVPFTIPYRLQVESHPAKG